MKNSNHALPKNRVYLAVLIIILIPICGLCLKSQGASPAEILEKGIYTEETKGEIKAATQIYEQLMADPKAERDLVAQAQLRLGLCHLKLGDKSKAAAALEQLTQDFPDKGKLLSMVEKQMPSLLDDIIGQIEQNYIKEIDRSELMETAIRALTGKLDPFSTFLGAQELGVFNRSLEQQIAGIGVKLKLDESSRRVIVETPLPNSPALKAGLRPGDWIVEINGQATAQLAPGTELQDAAKLIQGKRGQAVTLRVQHLGATSSQKVKIVRDLISLASVLGDRYKPDGSWDLMLDAQRKIGYLRLTEIGQQSVTEMETALEELTSHGMKGLILDLRNNGGGLLHGAADISDLFLTGGTIVSVRGRNGTEQVLTAAQEGTFSGFPMVVLINRQTVSAAEIIAAALQDHNRALVIGERTGGHGLVKSLIRLEDGQSALRLTTGEFCRPNGKSIHRAPEAQETDDWGVRPDERGLIALSEEEAEQYKSYRRERDTLGAVPKPDSDYEDRILQKGLELLSQGPTENETTTP